MVPHYRMAKRCRPCMPSIPFNFFHILACREDSATLSELLLDHRRNTHGSKLYSFLGCPPAYVLQLGFVIPLGTQPEQCYDEITPNDMYSSLTCAFSGASLVSGGLSFAVWIFIRALSMHLQICWDVTPGKKFFYWAQGLGWFVVAAFFALTLTITGVSFRFGDVCHVNAKHSMSDLWAPLLAIAGGAVFLQGGTFVYCIKVYLHNMFSHKGDETQSSAGLPSYTDSVQTRSARAVYRRVRKVLWLQWRSIAIVLFILVDVIFFSISFIWLNAITLHAIKDTKDLRPYVLCLLRNPTDPAPCYALGQTMSISESTVIAILMMLSIAGLQCFFLLARWSMVTGWLELFREKFGGNRDFVSLDAQNNICDLELKRYAGPEASSLSSTNLASSLAAAPRSITQDQSTKETQEIEREYRSPTLSFSTPQPRSRLGTANIKWDPTSSHARGGLGLHPPDRGPKI